MFFYDKNFCSQILKVTELTQIIFIIQKTFSSNFTVLLKILFLHGVVRASQMRWRTSAAVLNLS